jgi:hypothetical protein
MQQKIATRLIALKMFNFLNIGYDNSQKLPERLRNAIF